MSFLPAYHVEVAPGATPTRTAFVLHGILGNLRNWRTFARRIVRAYPDWRLVLVDLRNHGDSAGAPPPHTLVSCADDLAALGAHLGGPPELVMGHSFGGKVTLVYAREHGEHLRQAWVLDATPDAAPQITGLDNEVLQVIQAIDTLATPFARREDVVDALRARGFSDGLAQWMTTNLGPVPGGFDWRFDLHAVREMIADYWHEDLLGFLDEAPMPVHLVRAGRSDRWTPALLERLAHTGPNVHLHLLADAGHWVHVDDPDGLFAIVSEGYRAPSASR